MAITNQKELQAWIDLEDLSGNKLGSGPITNILAIIPLSDPQADNLATHINLFCYALVGGEVTEIGGGRITEIEYQPTQRGTSNPDLQQWHLAHQGWYAVHADSERV